VIPRQAAADSRAHVQGGIGFHRFPSELQVGLFQSRTVRGYLGERDGVVGQESHGPFGREVGDLSGT